MRAVILVLLFVSGIACAGSAGEFTGVPNVMERMVRGLSDSKIGELTSRVYSDGGVDFSYHLKTMDYLGTVERDGRRYVLGAAKFIRSSNKGSEYPPGRGHGFLVLFDDAFQVVSHGRMHFEESLHMEGNVLKSAEKVVADFGNRDVLTRQRGWLIDGSTWMAYPFADRITEEE